MDFNPGSFTVEKMMSIFKAMKITEQLSIFDYIKQSGYSFKLVLSLLIMMTVMGKKTVNASLPDLREHGITAGKDVFYRLKNNAKICWRLILWHIAMRFIQITESERLPDEKVKPHYLIFDDTTLEKTGKKIEKIGKVHDHVGAQKSVLGFKALFMLYWDGKSCVPLDLSLHSEKGQREERPYGMRPKDLRRQFSKKRVKESETRTRIEELDMDKITMMLKMFFSASFRCLQIDYVLVDSWFTCGALIKSVIERGVHLIGMYKIAKTKFLYKGKLLNCTQINARITGETRCKTSKLYYKRADVMDGDIPLTLFFTRRGTQGDWKVILTTDTKLSFKKLVEHYQVRWSIEVFIKECKGLLNLGGCQSSDFDAQIADTTIVMITHILLTFRFRFEYYESRGALFRNMQAENLRMTLDRRLWKLFIEVIRVVAEILEMDADNLLHMLLNKPQVTQLFEHLFDKNLKSTG
jgi:hypothetical protein